MSPLRELASKVKVYRLVTRMGRRLADSSASLAEGVERAYGLGPYPALWAVEGLGLAFTDREWEERGEPRGLAGRGTADGLPPESLLMLHAGMGLSLARRLLRRLSPGASPAEVERSAAEFLAGCRRWSLPGHLRAALESIGLVARCFFPRHAPAVAAALKGLDPELESLFWHGAGRALYFLPLSFVAGPSWPKRAFRLAETEPPHAEGRLNAQAGLAWAILMVNVRHPEVVTDRLGQAVDGGASAEAVGTAVASALTVRSATTPLAPFLSALATFEPRDAAARRRWERLVRAPLAAARERIEPQLAARGCLDRVFAFHPFDELLAEPRPSAVPRIR